MHTSRKDRHPLLENLEPRVLLSASVHPFASVSPFGTFSPQGYTPAQIRHAYGVDQLPYTGAGQTIAIIDAYSDPTIRTDLQHFDAAFGLPDPTFNIYAQPGITVDPAGPGNNNFEGEEALDVEWAHAMAPGAKILLVEARDATLGAVFGAVDYARRQPGVSVVSMSLGIFEFFGQAVFDPVFTTPAGHIPVTFVASTGDSAAPGSFPAYSANVVATGGTSLTLDSAGDYIGETGWTFSGGGISGLEAAPAYQRLLPFSRRATPDVAFDADPNTGVSIYDSYNNGGAGWVVIGGTSVAAPAWAGLIALANEGRNAAGKPTLNSATETLPLLYSAPAQDFHDITSGYNGFAAGTGYDLVTGLGSPVADQLIPWLITGSPTAAPRGNYPPFGFLDNVGPDKVEGWTIDPDSSATSLTVQLYVDGVFFGSQPASVTRNDLTAPYGSANHGFSFDISSLTPGKHKIQLFAIDTTTGNATLIGGVRTTNTNLPPTGWVDVFDNNTLKGWAWDPNSGAASIHIVYSVDHGPLRVALADGDRPDLLSHVGSTKHGFSIALPQLSFGRHTVRVYAVDSTTGDRIFIGQKVTFIPLIQSKPRLA
jgi:hypothetical protein